MTPKHHAVISGTGRAGTTFLVQLLTKLGVDTGFDPERMMEKDYHNTARAGMETDIRRNPAQYIVKSPQFCDYADQVFDMPEIVIDHVFVPMRDIRGAAESRRRVHRESIQSLTLWERIKRYLPRNKKKFAGGLKTLHVTDAEEVGQWLQGQLYKLLLACSSREVPVTLLHYPTHTADSRYTFNKLKPILGDVSYEQFKQVFEAVANPQLVSSYSDADKTAKKPG
ncbi:hypothetical protein [Lewinella sp. IMCC34183]|uniref:hypothetical protein n=1 Tax=Lewinella sp. IMCC34183 TaxID=2248762 RepID=UPI0013005E84|nr:hypothetical protein [Lewinella sp. IMCC34183]